MRKTIPLRETLTPDIFDEMTANYPLTAVDGREYKQELKYYSFPSDFDFIQFRLDCEEKGINYSDAVVVWTFLSAQMCAEHGYYCINRKALLIKMTYALGFGEEQCKTIIDALIDTGYLYDFDGRYTNIPVVRTFECVQSTRISNRTRRKPSKMDGYTAVSDESPEPSEAEAVEPPEMGKEELKFFEDIEKKDKVFF